MLTKDHLPVLKTARMHIESGAQSCICFALSAVDADERLIDECCHHIQTGIAGEAFLTTWVCSQVPTVWWLQEGATSYSHPNRDEALAMRRLMRRLMRLAWLDKIIYDLETES